jgi:Na+/H+-dicarboxylate symporter
MTKIQVSKNKRRHHHTFLLLLLLFFVVINALIIAIIAVTIVIGIIVIKENKRVRKILSKKIIYLFLPESVALFSPKAELFTDRQKIK